MRSLLFAFRTDAGWVSGLVTERGLAALSLPMATREKAIEDATASFQASFHKSRPGTPTFLNLKAVAVGDGSMGSSDLRLVAGRVKDWVSAYLSEAEGGRPAFLPDFPLDFDGMSPFRRAILLSMSGIPHGMVSSYSGLAEAAGYPGRARAAGGVCAANPIPLVIPCHRVVLSDGRIGEFGGGKEMKKWLLEREGVALERRAGDWTVEASKFWTFR